MTHIPHAPATELAAAIRSGELGSLEVTETLIDRVERLDGEINAVVCRRFEEARSEARAADAARTRGAPLGPLHGLPMTVKESYNVTGLPTSWGVPEFRDNIATTDATVVARLREAGAIILGKTNVPRLLMDWQSFNEIYGTTHNPWALDRTPGGSSGGAAAALACGFTPLEAGSDIASSLRDPAHYCGVYGLKPTYGVVPWHGQALPGTHAPQDLAVCGPMARTAGDLELGLEIMAGPLPDIGAGWTLSLPPSTRHDLADFRIAMMVDHPRSPVDGPYVEALEDLARRLEGLGARVDMVARPRFDLDRAHDLYIRLLRAATSPGMNEGEIRAVLDEAASADPTARQAGYLALMADGITLSHRNWLELNNERARLCRLWAQFFEDWDLFLSPVAASAAWPHDQDRPRHHRTIMVNGTPQPSTDQIFWAGLATLCYLPALSAPIGFLPMPAAAKAAPATLPIGVQIMAGAGQERSAIRFAQLMAEAGLGGFVAPTEQPSGRDQGS